MPPWRRAARVGQRGAQVVFVFRMRLYFSVPNTGPIEVKPTTRYIVGGQDVDHGVLRRSWREDVQIEEADQVKERTGMVMVDESLYGHSVWIG